MATVNKVGKIKDQKERNRAIHPDFVNFLDMYDDDQLKKCMAQLLKYYDEAKSWRTTYRSKWYEAYQLYRNYSPYYETRPEWQSSIFVPKCFELVETIHPRIMSALYDTPPLMACVPKRPEYTDASRQLEMLLETRVEQTNLYMTHYDTIKECLIYGTSVNKLGYVQDKDYEGSMTWHVDLFDFYPDPMGDTDIQKKRFCFERDLKHVDELKLLEEQGVYRNVGKLKSNASNQYISSMDRLRSIGYSNDTGTEGIKDAHEVLEFWGKWTDTDTKETFDVVAVIGDREHFLRFEESPMQFKSSDGDFWYALKPYVVFKNIMVPKEFYGIGQVEIIKSLQYELNDRRNAISDALAQNLMPVYEMQAGAIEDPDTIEFAPGNIIIRRGDKGLEPVQKDMSFVQGYQDMSSLKQDMQDASGIFDPMRGAVSQRRLTATEAVTLQQEGNIRTRQLLLNFDKDTLPKWARMVYLLERQFTDDKVLTKVYEQGSGFIKGFQEINPMQLKWEGDFKMVVASQYGVKALAVNQHLEFLKIIMSMPQAAGMLDLPKFIKTIASKMDINPELFVQPKPQGPPPGMPMPGQGTPGGPPPVMGPSLGGPPPPNGAAPERPSVQEFMQNPQLLKSLLGLGQAG